MTVSRTKRTLRRRSLFLAYVGLAIEGVTCLMLIRGPDVPRRIHEVIVWQRISFPELRAEPKQFAIVWISLTLVLLSAGAVAVARSSRNLRTTMFVASVAVLAFAAIQATHSYVFRQVAIGLVLEIGFAVALAVEAVALTQVTP